MNSEKTKCWLSICIPTFNRSQYLRLTLESITNQELFQNSDEIEIVISDNCSSDDTQSVTEQFQTLYPEKISFHRQAINLGEANFELFMALTLKRKV